MRCVHAISQVCDDLDVNGCVSQRIISISYHSSSSDPYIEIYRYRAYQDKVSAVVWEQMKKNLWEKGEPYPR